MATKREVASALFVIASAYQVELTESVVLAYSIALEPFTNQELVEATTYAVKHCERMPTPALLANVIRDKRFAERNKKGLIARELMRTQAVKNFRSRNPRATAEDVMEFLTDYDTRVARRTKQNEQVG
jgi:hypothetical protein